MHPHVHRSTIYNCQDKSNLDAHSQKSGQRSCGTYIQWNITQPLKKMKSGLPWWSSG